MSWSTWSAVINLTPRTGELRSAPSWPDARDRVTGKRALALRGARSQGKGRKVNTVEPCRLVAGDASEEPTVAS